MTKNVVEVMLAIQISRAHFLFDNLRDELVSEPVLFHLIRRLGIIIKYDYINIHDYHII